MLILMRSRWAVGLIAVLSVGAVIGPVCAESSPLSAAEQQRLIAERQTTAAQLDEARLKYTPQHPRLLALRRQLAEQDSLIKDQVSPTQLRRTRKQRQLVMARKQATLEAQLADAQVRYAPEHPRILALRQEIANCARQTTPQATAQMIPEQMQALQAERASLQRDLFRAQQRYTDNALPLLAARQRLQVVDRQIQILGHK